MLDVSIDERTFVRPDGAALKAVDRLHFTLADASFTCIVGPSGCGKTTTLRIVLGLDRGFRGELVWRDVATGSGGAIPGRIAAVFQEPRLLPWRSVEDNVRLPLGAGIEPKTLDRLFDELGLGAIRHLFPAELSLGMARRVALARAFAVEPALLVLDEPFVSLDEATAGRLRTMLLGLWRARPTTTLMVTHDLVEAAELADRVLVFSARPATLAGCIDIATPQGARDLNTIHETVERIRRVNELAEPAGEPRA